MLSRPRLSTAMARRKKERRAQENENESCFERRVRIKREKGTPRDEIIDLIYEEYEHEKRVAGRYQVNCMSVGEAVVEVIEFLSDVEADECAAGADVDSDSESNASTLELEREETTQHARAKPATAGSAQRLLPVITVDLTTASEPQDGLLHEYESIYVDLAESSSSDDYESTDDADGSDSDDGNDDGNAANDEDSEKETPRALVQRRRRQLCVARAPPVDKGLLMAKVRKDIERLEEHKPWRFVFRCLKLPFMATPQTDTCGFVFERWDNFWTQHGRAVWERMFWKPLYDGTPESNQRKYRQEKAAGAFCELAVELKTRFGSELVDEVADASQPHPGWWYRLRRPLNVLRLRCCELQLYQLHLSRYRERWPCGRRYVRQNTDAMWCFAKRSEDTEPEEEP